MSTRHWQGFLDACVPMTQHTGAPLVGRTLTLAEHKREAIDRLYRSEHNVGPWGGTAQGVVKAVNTYDHHERTVRGAPRAERNMLRSVTGDFGRLDRGSMKTLQKGLTS